TQTKKTKKRFDDIGTRTTTASKDSNYQQSSTYDTLLKAQYKITKVVRIERTEYANSIFGKTGDFTAKTIDGLIEEGVNDATNASLV
ncbi:MAG TPA: hypothetical protein VFJ51_04215, partial [Nitrososphaeraceae archaeon]|nr:hypothetical protein [Nitrososphaeraceae archaeon]